MVKTTPLDNQEVTEEWGHFPDIYLKQKSNYSGLKKCPDRFHWGQICTLSLLKTKGKSFHKNKKYMTSPKRKAL